MFDEHGQRMTPTHTNKRGMRYRYYVSHPVLRKHAPASVGRVPAPELEAVVVDAVRRHLQLGGTDPKSIPDTDRELIERHLLRAALSGKELTLHLRQDIPDSKPGVGSDESCGAAEIIIAIPWTLPAASPAKGIAYVPAHNTPMKPGRRELLLIAIAKAHRETGPDITASSATQSVSNC